MWRCIPTSVITLATQRLIDLALEEDLGAGDQTTLATVAADARCSASVVAKGPLTLAGGPFFMAVFHRVDPSVEVVQVADEGARLTSGDGAFRLTGLARSILSGERTALNILQRLSGTATLTRQFVDAIEGTSAKVIDTRKTTPGMRAMQKYAVRVGGGLNHRFGLDSGVLIKDNHIVSAGGLRRAVELARAACPHGLKVEVEVTTEAEFEAALVAGADIIMLDNMTSLLMGQLVRRAREHAQPVVLEASGNLGLERVREVAQTGVDYLSIGALTHSALAADLSMRFAL